jgi:hypothetical protein
MADGTAREPWDFTKAFIGFVTADSDGETLDRNWVTAALWISGYEEASRSVRPLIPKRLGPMSSVQRGTGSHRFGDAPTDRGQPTGQGSIDEGQPTPTTIRHRQPNHREGMGDICFGAQIPHGAVRAVGSEQGLDYLARPQHLHDSLDPPVDVLVGHQFSPKPGKQQVGCPEA